MDTSAHFLFATVRREVFRLVFQALQRNSLSFQSSLFTHWSNADTFLLCSGPDFNAYQDRYIPDDFREWGVEIKGFESLTSSNLFNDGSSLLMKRTRAMPSVGCEADAVVPEVHEHTFSNIEEKRVSGGFPDGSVICGPAVMTNEHSQRWDVCLTDPTDGVKSRVRLQFSLVNEPFGAVNAMIEHWDAPFCNGEVLPGCGGKNESFADGARMDPVAELVGKWDISSILYTARDGEWEMEELSFEIDRDGATVSAEINVVLPHGITVGIACAEDGTKTVVAGWKTAENIRAVSRQVYASSGVLLCVSRDVESRAC